MTNLMQVSVREEIRKRFPDTCFAVANRIDSTYDSVQSIIATWPNKLDENPGIVKIAETEEIGIINLSALSNGNIDFLVGKDDRSLKNPSLISDGVIPIMNHGGKKVISVTQRDSGGNADNGLYTSVAGRAEGDIEGIDLRGESLREWLEEGTYLGELDGEIFIVLPKVGKQIEKSTSLAGDFIGIDNANGIRSYLGSKYLIEEDPDYDKAKNEFEGGFPEITYGDLPDILKDAYRNGRILFYDTQENIQENVSAPILMDGLEVRGFNWRDEGANTLEHRLTFDVDLSHITDKNGNKIEGVKLIGKDHPQSLYLESKYQGNRNIEVGQKVEKREEEGKIKYFVTDIKGKVTQVVATTGEFLLSQNS